MARRSTNSATSRRPTADRTRRTAGFTILELLVVIGIVLAIGAVALPFTLREIDRRQEAETIDRLGLLLRFARAESRATGVPVVLRVDPDGGAIEARMIDPREVGDTVAGLLDGSEAEESQSVSDDFAGRIMAAWSRVELPDGLRLEPASDLDDLDSDAFFADAGLSPLLDQDPVPLDDPSVVPWPSAVSLAIFLPDGTAIGTQVFGITTARGWRRCVIDPYGGRLVVEGPSIRDLDAAIDGVSPEAEEIEVFDGFEDDRVSSRDETPGGVR
jgi:type II secretory pathway pseudopilin PulG